MEILCKIQPLYFRKPTPSADSNHVPVISRVPPPRPPRASSRPKQSTVRVIAASVPESPKPQDWYDPSAGYKSPRCSIESARGCGRADSIDLDPHLENEAARDFRRGVSFAHQVLVFPASDDCLTPSTESTPSRSATAARTDASNSDDEVAYGPFRRCASTLPGTMGPSMSCVSLASAFSGSTSSSNCDERSKLRRRTGLLSIKAGKALLSSAIKKLSASPVAEQGPVRGAARSRDLPSNPAISPRRPALPTTAKPLNAAATTGSSDESDGGISRDFPARSLSSPSTISLPIRGKSATSRTRRGLSQATAEAQREKETKDMGRPTRPALDQDDQQRSASRIDEKVPAHLPSYHRGLRKQVYPPRVRYEVRQDLTRPACRESTPPTVPAHFPSHVRFGSAEHEEHAPRLAGGRLRKYSRGQATAISIASLL